MQTFIDFIQWCIIYKVHTLTAYAFSTENWSRDANEVQTLMSLFVKYADSFREEAMKKDIKFVVFTTGDTAATCCNGISPPGYDRLLSSASSRAGICISTTGSYQGQSCLSSELLSVVRRSRRAGQRHQAAGQSSEARQCGGGKDQRADG